LIALSIAFQNVRALNFLNFEIPSRMQILDKKVLSLTWDRFNFNSRFIRDIIINLIGFIPLGFFLNATFVKAGGSFERHGVLITVVLCITVSLAIKTLQAWMPSRSSDCLDFVLNTLGALLGVMLVKAGRRGGWEARMLRGGEARRLGG